MIRVFKIGGNVVDNASKLDAFLADFARIEGEKVLVHGGGKVATQISSALGIKTTMIDGRRVTDAATLNVVTMVYAGGVNKEIVAKLQLDGCNALGLCGADGGLIRSHKRPALPIDYGFVGDPYSVNAKLIRTLTESGYVVVAAPITFDDKCGLLNTNADTVAACIATSLASQTEVELVYCFEKAGVLSDVDDDSSVINHISESDFAQLKADGTISAGMLPKLENAFKAINNGVRSVVICNADNVAAPQSGTTLVK